MEIRNCRQCGRLFNYMYGSGLCPSCMRDLEDKFSEVKEYIYDNPGAGVAEVSEKCDVSVNQIRQWVREERLEFADGSVTGINCEGCGKPIRTGKFCAKCKEQMIHTLENAYEKPKKENQSNEEFLGNARMRFFK